MRGKVLWVRWVHSLQLLIERPDRGFEHLAVRRRAGGREVGERTGSGEFEHRAAGPCARLLPETRGRARRSPLARARACCASMFLLSQPRAIRDESSIDNTAMLSRRWLPLLALVFAAGCSIQDAACGADRSVDESDARSSAQGDHRRGCARESGHARHDDRVPGRQPDRRPRPAVAIRRFRSSSRTMFEADGFTTSSRSTPAFPATRRPAACGASSSCSSPASRSWSSRWAPTTRCAA